MGTQALKSLGHLGTQDANWQKVNICEWNDYYYCAYVCQKIKDFGNACGQAHWACKKTFNLWYTKIKDEYGEKDVLERKGKFYFW